MDPRVSVAQCARGGADQALIVKFSHVMNATAQPVRVVLQSSERDVHARGSLIAAESDA